ncbi:hypothetical protein [Bacillus cereus group sp. TH152-1LC]|uniref:hypothetical protein n=1 Tax=Bacillus cereus group sp. TH152-1LC TaxID=3018060 RepID=UPI0022E784B1|nr:hypothetical protein [Bacillus cereus group sp. TH152-1LC]MDA1675309.1 hypothetical protein [Bacillus cereus group sp. TH152-1LC]
MRDEKNDICNLLKEKLRKMSAEEKIARTNQLHADLETIYEDMSRIDGVVKEVTMNVVSEAFDNLHLEFQFLAVEGFYAEKQYEVYKNHVQYIEHYEMLDGFGSVQFEKAAERLRDYIEEEDIKPKQSARMRARINYRG